jgi:DNA-directed RNA polymerase specialized sigma subunit
LRTRISKERLSFIQNQLSKSNALLEKYHSQITTDCGRLGFRIIGTNEKLNKINFVNFICSSPITKDIVVSNVTITKEDALLIANSKNYESEILLNFMGIFSKIATKWSSYSSDVCLSKEDLESEAIQAAMLAIYNYTDVKTSLSTYLYHCVANKIRNIFNKTNSLSDFGSNAIDIRKRFDQAKNSLGEFCTYDEIIQSLNFTNKEIQILQSMFAVVGGVDFGDEKASNDYTCLGKKFSGLDGSVSYNCSSNGDSFTIHNEENNEDVKFDTSDFSELEKVVLEGFMNSTSNLGISHFAKNLINPKTKKPYTRMAMTYAWRRVKDKIKKYSKVA